jgi:hypothetical protein
MLQVREAPRLGDEHEVGVVGQVRAAPGIAHLIIAMTAEPEEGGEARRSGDPDGAGFADAGARQNVSEGLTDRGRGLGRVKGQGGEFPITARFDLGVMPFKNSRPISAGGIDPAPIKDRYAPEAGAICRV